MSQKIGFEASLKMVHNHSGEMGSIRLLSRSISLLFHSMEAYLKRPRDYDWKVLSTEITIKVVWIC